MDEGPEGEEAFAAQQLAHDLLQSIAIIRATVGTHRRTSLDGTAAPMINTIEREVAIMAGLCEEELNRSQLATAIDPAIIATSVVDRMRVAYAGELLLDLDGVSGLGTSHGIVGSASEWERSLLNLVENGCRAAGPAGRVLVRCGSSAEELTISVADSGPGFGQAPAGRSSLGMVAVMRLVEHHGGHLELRRSDLGGALLTVVLPIAARPESLGS